MEDLTIEDLIRELQKYPNQKAKINFIVNVVNTESKIKNRFFINQQQ